MVKGISNAVIQNGGDGGEKKFVTNTTTNTYDKGEKVLVNLGIRPSELSRGFDLSGGSYDSGCVFIDNNTVRVDYRGSDSNYSFSNYSWNSYTPAGNLTTARGTFATYRDGTVRLGCMSCNVSSANTGAIVTTSTVKILPSKYSYIGSYNGYGFAISDYSKTIVTYDMSTNKVGDTALFTEQQAIRNAYIDINGLGFVCDRYANWRFLKVSEDGTLARDGYYYGAMFGTNNPSDTAPIYCTGCDVGDFIFFVTNSHLTYDYASSTNGHKQVSNLVVYEITANESGSRTLTARPDLFKMFQSENCLIFYDNRNDVLTIGTMDNVYAYKFNRDDKNFEQLNYTFMLSSNINQNYCYRLAFSPDMSKAIITIKSTYNTMSVTLYTLGNANWEIVDNQVINYNVTTSFSAITTGEVDEDGKVEVKLTLPDKVDLVIDTNVEVNEGDIIIEGVE